MKLIFMRHAEAKRGTCQKSKQDFGLTAKGKAQAERIATSLKGTIDRIITSPLPRAIETGKIVSESLGHQAPESISELAEFRELETFENESLEEFFDRIELSMNRIADLNQTGTTLAITHAGFIMGSIRTLFDIPTPGTGARFEPDYLSLTEWTKNDVWELRYYNLCAMT